MRLPTILTTKSEFMRFIEPKTVQKMLSDNIMRMWACENSSNIIGVIGARSNHIYLLFVNGNYHRKGIARQLLNMMIEHFNPSFVTVNSSPYAVEIYHKLGFIDTDKEKIVNGIRFVPMKFSIQSYAVRATSVKTT